MANPTLIQKQIKDNSEDLHNFVRDLKLWEEEMKRKDRQLLNNQKEEILPPIRRPKLAKKTPPDTEEKSDTRHKKIRSYDYKSWDTFDVEKACEDIDKEGEMSKNVDGNDEDGVEQEEKYLKEKALYEKELGNQHVKSGKWDKAIEAYTRAIEANARDPIFFANRALCYLKQKKYKSVESDCTESLKLDPTYVKAYLRRAAAREALDRLQDARQDLSQVLLLEPNNTQAQQDLSRIKALITNGGKKKGSVKKADTEAKQAKQSSSKKESVTQEPNIPNIASLNEKKANTKQSSSKSVADNIEAEELMNEPNWHPCNNIIESISKPPHLHSKKILRRVEIHDIGLNLPEHVCARKLQMPQNSSIVETTPAAEATLSPSGVKPRSVLTLTSGSTTVGDNLPVPKTSVQFHKSWSGIKDNSSQCFRFLKQIPGGELPNIFKESLESQMFSSILEVLSSEFVTADEPVLQYLKGLSSVRRFSTITLFMSSTDKSNLSKLFEHCINKRECSQDDMEQLRRLYELN